MTTTVKRRVLNSTWGFVVRIWDDARPVIERAMTDVLITTTLWSALFFFQLLEKWLPVGGWAGTFVVQLHKAGAVVLLSVFMVMSATSLWLQLKRRAAMKT